MALTLVTDINDNFNRLEACKRFVDNIRHSSVLNMEVIEATENDVLACLPWQPQLVGDPDTQVIHGGALFAFLDQLGGLACVSRLFPDFDITPTIDFRLDHLHSPEPQHPIMAKAECYRLSSHVAFVRFEAWQQHDQRLDVATGLATYMRMKLTKSQTGGWNKGPSGESGDE